MIGMSKLTHRIEKKAVEILVDRIMAERNPADRQKKLKRLSYVMQHLFGDLFEKESFDDDADSSMKGANGSASSIRLWIP